MAVSVVTVLLLLCTCVQCSWNMCCKEQAKTVKNGLMKTGMFKKVDLKSLKGYLKNFGLYEVLKHLIPNSLKTKHKG